MKIIFLLLGVLFGLILSQAGATQFDLHAGLFLFENFHLAIVIMTALLVGLSGVWLMKTYQVKALTGDPIKFDNKPFKNSLIAGALLFGAGWGMTGTCPGAAPAMLGEGQLMVIPSLVGIFLGTYLFGFFSELLKKTKPPES